MNHDTPPYLTTKQVAKLLQVSEAKLKAARSKRTGLPYVKLDGSVRYPRAAVERYLELNTVQPRI